MGSFFGNIFIVIIVYKHRDLRKTINYFIVNMAVSDLIFPLIVIPVYIIGLATESWHWRVSGILGSIFCKLFHFSSGVTLHVSAQSLVWIAIDRFVAVVFPIKLGLISPKIRTTAIVSTWIFAGLFNSPSLIMADVVVHDNKNAFCTNTLTGDNPDVSAAISFAPFALLFIAPLVVITVLYTAIAIALRRQNRALTDNAQNLQRHSEKKRRQAIRMAVIIVALFYICVIPSTLLYFAPYWNLSCASQRLFFSLASLAFSLSSMVNPIICLSFVESYRHGLRNILCPCTNMPDNMTAKREHVTPQEMENLSAENIRRVLKDTETYKDTLNTAM
ncbi:tachykinin-like peptides receptor 86C [Orbicella faveolata]|uniref:tachykinin-like peptides receptor 86C n=1 Tax=Orbicella faveolata TaxID=48498 RepID=UPI0009E57E74|nr:tachykinin-like peptides receptor 86C [Orbicella faveolata]